jgi:hypothetical protein
MSPSTKRIDTGIPQLPRVLQMMCTASHTILYREGHTIDARGSAKNRAKRVLISSPATCNVTIMSLVELPAGRFSAAGPEDATRRILNKLKNHSRTGYEGEHRHGS